MHRYRRWKTTRSEQPAERLAGVAAPVSLPRAALRASPRLAAPRSSGALGSQPLADADPFHELTLPRALEATRAMAAHLGLPWATLSPEPLDALHALRRTTLAQLMGWEPVRQPLEPL